MNGDKIAAVNMYCGNQTIFVCEKAVSILNFWMGQIIRKWEAIDDFFSQ